MYYSTYGLIIDSTLDLPELQTLDGTPKAIDVEINLASLPKNGLDHAQQIGLYVWAGQNLLWLRVPGIATYLVSDGRRILIDSVEGIDGDSVRVFLLDSVFGALLLQRGYLVLNGNSIVSEDTCLVCAGSSGSGKSSLTAGFLQRGHTVLGDELVALDAQGQISPGVPRIKLWEDMVDHFGLTSRGLHRIRPQLRKFNLPVPHVDQEQTWPVRYICILEDNRLGSNEIGVHPVNGLEKFMLLYQSTYRKEFVAGMHLKRQHLELCSALSSRAYMARITYPHEGSLLDSVLDEILRDARRNTR